MIGDDHGNDNWEFEGNNATRDLAMVQSALETSLNSLENYVQAMEANFANGYFDSISESPPSPTDKSSFEILNSRARRRPHIHHNEYQSPGKAPETGRKKERKSAFFAISKMEMLFLSFSLPVPTSIPSFKLSISTPNNHSHFK
jgi:hypothetical protein